MARCLKFAKTCVPRLCGRKAHRLKSVLQKLALGELEALAGAFLSVLLALFHARIAREKTVGAQRGAKLRVVLRDGARKAHANRSSLAADAAAVHGAHDVDLVRKAGELE